MRFGIGPGPVFAYEWLRIARRPRLYAGRAAFVGAILAALLACAPDSHPLRPYLSADETAAFARRAHRSAAAVEMLLILFIAPAATAGAICLDRARGALVQVMATDLTDAEIVLGKLAAALIPVVGLLLAALPVQMLLCLLGGVDPSALAGAFAGILATGVLACTLAFALSAWGRKAHEVLAAAYLLIFLWLTAYPFVALAPRFRAWLPPPWDGAALALLKATHPYPIVEPPFNEGFAPFAARVATYVGACLGVSAGLVVATIVSIRPLALRRASSVERPRRRLPALLPEPSLDANPVLWREWCRARPSAWGRATWAVYGLIGLGAAATALYDVAASPGPRFTVAPVLANMFIVGFGLLLVAVRSATSLSEERVRGTLDVLLATPMTTPEILAGKWWGAFRPALGLAIPAVVVGAAACLRSAEWANLAWLTALILAYGAAVTSLGLALAVRVPRQGAALALTVGLYLATCTGWAWYGTIHYTGDVDTGRAIAMGAPHWGAGFGTESVANSHVLDPAGTERLFPAWLIVWAAAYGLLAAALFSAAARSFDASLGRMPARGGALRALVPSFRRPRPAMLEEARP